jgi:hypothetical protein
MKLLTENEMQERLSEVATLRVALDPDPMANGLTSVNKKIAELQLYKDRLSYLITEALHNQNTSEVLYETIKGEYDRELEILLATDSQVMTQKSAEMRNATAKQRIPEKVLKVHRAEIDHLKAQGYLNVLKNIYGNLESCNSNLSRQITVLQMSMQLNGIQRSANGEYQAGQITKTY